MSFFSNVIYGISLTGGTIYSGSTDLSLLFVSNNQLTVSTNNIALLQSQMLTKVNRSGDTMTGTLNGPSISGGTVSGGTLYSGTTNVGNLFITNSNSIGVGKSIATGKTNNNLLFKTVSSTGAIQITDNGSTLYFNAIIPIGAYLIQYGVGLYSIKASNLSNRADGDFSLVGNGKYNYIYNSYVGSPTTYSTILNGRNNYVFASRYSTILGGIMNRITSYTLSGFNTIVNGSNNRINGIDTLDGQSITYSTIINGSTNRIYDNFLGKSRYSTIINGFSNGIYGSSGSTIIGGNNYTLTNEHNTVLVPKLKIANLPTTTGTYMLAVNSSGNVFKNPIPTGSGTSSSNNNGINTFTAGTSSFQSINVTGLSINNLTTSGETFFISASATTFSASTIYSGSTNLSSLFFTSSQGANNISNISLLQSQINTKVNRSGDTMTGTLYGTNISANTISANTIVISGSSITPSLVGGKMYCFNNFI